MKAKKATQQKMYRENSWGEGKQRLEELFIISSHFLTGSSQTARVKEVVWNSSAAGNWFERIARAVRTDNDFFEWTARGVRKDDNFSRTDSMRHSKGWHFFFERIAVAVRTDTKSLEKPFTTISNFVWHEIRGICVRVAQCIKVGNGPLKSHCHGNKNYRPLQRSRVCPAYTPVGVKDSDDDSPPLIMFIVRGKFFFLFIGW